MPLESQYFWIKTGGITMHPAKTLFSYGMIAPKNGARGFLMCLQAYLLKYTLFEKKEKKRKSIRKNKDKDKSKALQPSRPEQVGQAYKLSCPLLCPLQLSILF